MSTLDELLDEQLEAQENPVCVIDKLTRKINMLEEFKFFGVEHDKRVERIKFECPKYVGDENVDLMACKLFIAYENANGEPGLYEVKDAATSGEVVSFSWLFDEDVTRYKGDVSFIFYASKMGRDTTEAVWNTTLAQGFVEEGLEVSGRIEERSPAIIELMLIRIANLEQNGGATDEQIENAIEKYLDENPIEVGNDFFIVSVDFDVNVASHSMLEIRDAFESGKIVITTDSYGMMIPLYDIADTQARFMAIYESDGLKKIVLTVDANKNVASYTESIVSGAVSATGTVELLADNWVEYGANEYHQEVLVSGVPDDIGIEACKVDITLPSEVLSDLCGKNLTMVTENNGGVVTVHLFGQKLTNTYEVQATLTKVECNGGKIVGAVVGASAAGGSSGGTVTDEQIAEALENYLKENPLDAGAGSSIFYSSLSFEYDAGSMLSFFNCDKQEIRRNGREVQVGDLIIFGNLSLGIVEELTSTNVSGSLYASLKGESGSGGGLDATIDGETLVFAESSTATIENETLIL